MSYRRLRLKYQVTIATVFQALALQGVSKYIRMQICPVDVDIPLCANTR